MLAPLFSVQTVFDFFESIRGQHMWYHFEAFCVSKIFTKRIFRNYIFLYNYFLPFLNNYFRQLSLILIKIQLKLRSKVNHLGQQVVCSRVSLKKSVLSVCQGLHIDQKSRKSLFHLKKREKNFDNFKLFYPSLASVNLTFRPMFNLRSLDKKGEHNSTSVY